MPKFNVVIQSMKWYLYLDYAMDFESELITR